MDRDRPRDYGRSRGDDRRRSRSRSPDDHTRKRHRSRSRSPRRRSLSPRRHQSPSHSNSGSGKKDRNDPSERRRVRSTSRSRSRDDDRSRSRSRRRDRSREKRKRSRSRSRSRSVSSASSGSSDHRRHKRKKDKHKKKRSRSRDRKEKKKSKKEKKKHKTGAVGHHQWGKYGIINESDLYNKEQEFRSWLVEERKINPETISKDQTKKEFARFVEDYNTATLPHEKFYHMEQYERRMTALRAGEYLPPADDSYDPAADMRALASSHKRRPVEQDTYMSKDQLMELRRVQNERIEAGKMKLLGMDIKHNMGVRMDGSMFDG